MTQLPKFTWDIDPVFLQVPKNVVVGGLGIFAAISLFIGLRKKAGDQLLTALIFGALAFVAYERLGENFDLRYYSALFLGVFLGGYSLLKWQIVRGGGRAEDAGDFIVYGVLGVLIGARLGHVLFYDLDKAIADPMWVFKIWTGGLASHGAVLGLIAAMWLFTKRRGVPFLEGADRFAFSAALGATLVRVGNWFNSEIVGRKVPGQTWGVWFKRVDEVEVYRYPTQLAQITLGLVVLLALYLVDRKYKENRPRGLLIATFFSVYFTGRFFIEFYKEYEGISSSSPVTMGQILSTPAILLGFFGLYWSFKKHLPWVGPTPTPSSRLTTTARASARRSARRSPPKLQPSRPRPRPSPRARKRKSSKSRRNPPSPSPWSATPTTRRKTSGKTRTRTRKTRSRKATPTSTTSSTQRASSDASLPNLSKERSPELEQARRQEAEGAP